MYVIIRTKVLRIFSDCLPIPCVIIIILINAYKAIVISKKATTIPSAVIVAEVIKVELDEDKVTLIYQQL